MIDIYEFYSYILYMYGYGIFYIIIFEQPLFKAILISIFFNFILNYTINHNTIKFIMHKYWKKNLNNIVIPQLLTFTSNTLIYNNYSKYITIPANIIIYNMISKYYINEISYSKNLRFILLFIFILYRHFSHF